MARSTVTRHRNASIYTVETFDGSAMLALWRDALGWRGEIFYNGGSLECFGVYLLRTDAIAYALNVIDREETMRAERAECA